MDAESQYLEELKAHLNRLENQLSEAVATDEKQKTELARLNAEFDRVMFVSDRRAKRLEVCIPLISLLCDALTRVRPHLAQPDLDLIQRAREENLLRNKIWQLEVDEKDAEIERLKQKIKEQEEYIRKLKRNAKGVTGQ